MNLQNETTHQGETGWGDQDEEGETREVGESESEEEGTEQYFQSFNVTMVGTQEETFGGSIQCAQPQLSVRGRLIYFGNMGNRRKYGGRNIGSR